MGHRSCIRPGGALRPASTGHDRPGWGRTGPSKGANTANVTRQTDAPELADLLETVERLRPVIEEYAAAAEADRHLAEPVYRAMFDARAVRDDGGPGARGQLSNSRSPGQKSVGWLATSEHPS